MLSFMLRVSVVSAAVVAVSATSATAATKQCGTVKGVGDQTTVTKVTTTSGTCMQAKIAAKAFARTGFASGYTCRGRSASADRTNATCRKSGRVITFTVTRKTVGGFLPPTGAAPPSVGGS